MYPSYYNNPYLNYGNMNNQVGMNQNYVPQNYNQVQQPTTNVLQGKIVDSVDVVKGLDIPLDGSISYFPMATGDKIVTKRLNLEGKSEIKVYNIVETNEDEKLDKNALNQQVIQEMIENALETNLKCLQNDVKTLKRELEDLQDEMETKSTKSKK